MARPATASQYAELGQELTHLAFDMTMTGFPVSQPARAAHRERLTAEANTAERAFRDAAEVADDFNLRSGDQLRQLYYGKWNCEVQVHPKTKKPTIDKNALYFFRREEEREEIKAASDALIRFREARKTLEAFVENLPVLQDGRVHPFWGVFGAETLRWTCSGPNLQQLQKPEKIWDAVAQKMKLRRLGIRDMFCAPEGYTLVEADYSQLELRLMALFAQDPSLLAAFQRTSTNDIHADNAEILLGTRVGLAREIAKTLVYAMNYGADDITIFRQLSRKFPDLTLEWVRKCVRRWKAAHPAITAYKEQQLDFVAQNGYVYCPFSNGRIEFYMGLADPSDVINKRIQRSGSDLMNPATVEVWHALRELGALMIAQVHDALFCFAKVGTEQAVAQVFRDKMQTMLEYDGASVWVPVDVQAGPNWGAMEKIQ